jgi:YhcH/YjgK/YiaL family protein
MIIDRIENASRYYGLGTGIADALKYLIKNDPASFTPGNYEITKDKVKMIVFEYSQTNTDRIKMEAHRKNIDVQYWYGGSEFMGHAILGTQNLIEPFNEEKDYGNYNSDATFTKFESGMFAIYFPTDLHTAIADEQCDSMVKKIVFKVIVE